MKRLTISDYDLEDMIPNRRSHNTLDNRAHLQEKLPGRKISRLSYVKWTTRFNDVIALDIVLWGYEKYRVHGYDLPTLEQLNNIREGLWRY